RWRISAAAFRVKVIARIWSGSTPARSRLTYRSTSTRVLPVPAEASSRTFCEGSTACARAVRSGRSRPRSRSDVFSATVTSVSTSPSSNARKPLDIPEIILAAHRVVATGPTPIHIVWRRRDLSTRDRVNRVRQPLLRLGQHLLPIGGPREQRHHAFRTLERQVDRLAQPPAAAGPRQRLLGAKAVDRQLQRPRSGRRPTHLVVHPSASAHLPHVAPIDP